MSVPVVFWIAKELVPPIIRLIKGAKTKNKRERQLAYLQLEDAIERQAAKELRGG